MRFKYCPTCGSKAVLKKIGDEGEMPYCDTCRVPLFDMFSTCIIAAVINEEDEVALLRQSYVSETKYVCVAGYMKLGESAEDAAKREIKEELGLDTVSLDFVKSYPYLQKEMLMLGFKAMVKKAEFELSDEVESVEWVKFSDAAMKLREGSIARQLVEAVIKE
ncbi:MAG: NUDIX domain-containing protein [Ruminococcaceae bacterium]|nr:NUDIX domain-containing protein [Oscillospiraceae bacterium]